MSKTEGNSEGSTCVLGLPRPLPAGRALTGEGRPQERSGLAGRLAGGVSRRSRLSQLVQNNWKLVVPKCARQLLPQLRPVRLAPSPKTPTHGGRARGDHLLGPSRWTEALQDFPG